MLATVILLLALGAGTGLAQSGYDLFQKALVKERAVGDVEEALRLYQRIVKEFGGNHALAAKAQLRMGLLYDRLGREAEAQRAFQVIVNQYADQANEARQARAKIATAAASPRNTNDRAKTTTGLTVRLVWGDAAAGLAAISPDGNHVVYKSFENEALYVRDLLAGKNRCLTMAGSAAGGMGPIIAGPVFSPDGKLIAYGWKYDSVHTDLRFIALDGSAPRVLNRSAEWPQLVPLDWSSDGKQILGMARGQSGTLHIVLVSVADGSIHALKTVASDYIPSRMSLSPDGRYLVFDYPARGDSPERDIFLLGTDGGHEAGLVTQATDDRYPIWTPDGRGVLFFNRRAGTTGTMSAWFLRVLDGKPQGSPELVYPDMGATNSPIGFTRNGSFYYTLRSGTKDLYTATLEPKTGTMGQPATVTQRRVTQSGGWSPNGQYLAYGSRRPSAQGEIGVIVIRSMPTGEEHELATTLDFALSSGWSPDSRFLLVDAVDNEKRWGIYRVDARTGDVAPLVYYPPGGSFEHPVWSANGKSIVFIRRESNQDSASHRIVSRDLETGIETELYRPPPAFSFGSCLEVSADGQRLAFYLQHRETRTWSLMVMTAAGEQPRQLGPPVKYPERIDDILALTPDGRHVLFTTYDTEQIELGHKVWRIAVDGGDPQEIQIPKDLGYFSIARFHPDGQRITFAASNSKSTVWAMENFLSAPSQKKTTASRR
jgi:Tol biopolymer transport system component